MREPAAGANIFGLMAEFEDAERLIVGVGRARKAGFQRMDAYTPFPIDELGEALGFRDGRVAWLTLLGGVLGAVTGYGMQVYTNLAFPLGIGGRPLVATPAFMLIVFELTVLFAVLFSVGGMLLLNHLPRLHHPVFDVEGFRRATSDRFFLVVFSTDPRFDEKKTRRFLNGLGPVRVERIGAAEEPE